MEFSNSSNSLGIVEDVDFLCGTDSVSYPLNQKVRNINNHYQDVARLIWEVADGWKYDDSNASDLPKATVTLVHGTQDYAIPTTALKIDRIEVKNDTGTYTKMKPFDASELSTSITEYQSGDGFPTHYDLRGNFISLYPAPASASVTLASGMDVYLSRTPTLFTSASTTATPGFASPFHRVLSYSTAIDFEQDKIKLQKFIRSRDELIRGIKKFYSSRNVEQPRKMRPYSKPRWRQYQ